MHLSLSDIPPKKELLNIFYAVRPLSSCFAIPSEGYTSSSPPTFLLEYTWNKHQSTRYHTSQVLNALLLLPGIGLEISTVPVRRHSLDSSQCLKQ